MVSVLQTGRTRAAPLPSLRADRSKDVGRGRALIVWRRGPRSPLGPPPRDLVLLADPRLVRKPDLYPVRRDALLARDLVQARRKAFLKASTASLGLSMVPRPGRQFAVAERPQFPAQGLLGHRDPELVKEPSGIDRSAATVRRRGPPVSARSRSSSREPPDGCHSGARFARAPSGRSIRQDRPH